MMTSKRSLIGVAALFAVAATGACGSDDSAPTTTPGAGAPAAHAGSAGAAPASGGGGAASAGAPGAGAPSVAGAPGAGAPSAAGAAGSATGGASGGTGGTPGAGGAKGGAGGASAGSGGGSIGGGNTFAAVKTLIGMSCGVGNCHNAASKELDFQGTTDLYTLLTTPIATTIPHCNGSTLAVANDANSLIVRVTKGATMCSEGGQMKSLARMPDKCTGTKCLTDAQVKVLTDWIAAGAPK